MCNTIDDCLASRASRSKRQGTSPSVRLNASLHVLFSARLPHFDPTTTATTTTATIHDPNYDVVGVYPFGLDPVWKISSNEILFANSLKMKISVIFGVLHMVLGVCFKGANKCFFRDWNGFCNECVIGGGGVATRASRAVVPVFVYVALSSPRRRRRHRCWDRLDKRPRARPTLVCCIATLQLHRPTLFAQPATHASHVRAFTNSPTTTTKQPTHATTTTTTTTTGSCPRSSSSCPSLAT